MMWPSLRAGLAALTLGCGACGGDDSTGVAIPSGSLLADPTASLPEALSDVGLHPDLSDRTLVPDTVAVYTPRWPLWSSGSDKQRFLFLPVGETIDNREPDAWRYPVGTVWFKTFTDGDTPIETRLVRKLGDEDWEYATYQWDDEGQEATLLQGDWEVTVELSAERRHTIPSTLMCRECHESSPHPVLGDTELQLSEAVDDGPSPLTLLHERGLLAEPPPATPRRVSDHTDDDTTHAVLGDFVGNCVHCHNGTDGASSSFDLDPAVALANIIDQPTESSASAAGIRVVPGDPSASILFLAVSDEHDDPEIESMPPVGIDARDTAAIERLRGFIADLEP